MGTWDGGGLDWDEGRVWEVELSIGWREFDEVFWGLADLEGI